MPRNNLIGKVFNKLFIIEEDKRRYKKGIIYYKCRCICGKEKSVRASSLISGITKGCGKRVCLGITDNLVNTKFGKVTVLRLTDTPKEVKKTCRRYWLCKCDCGNETVKSTSTLKSKYTTSCGCDNSANETRFLKNLFKRCRRGAKVRDLDFKLIFEDFCEISKKNCVYCGSGPKNRVWKNQGYTKNFKCLANGIDRVDNSVGYLSNNVVSCCRICNIAKAEMTDKQFILWIRQVYKHTENKFFKQVKTGYNDIRIP